MLTWRYSPALQSSLTEAVRRATSPILLMDAAPEAIPALDRAMEALPHKMVKYPSYMPAHPMNGIAPGHALFEADGIPIWGRDAVSFLDGYLKT